MKKTLFLSIILVVFGAVTFGSPARAAFIDRKIVVFKYDISDEEKESIVDGAGAASIKHLKDAKSTVAFMGKYATRKLSLNPKVLRIDDDVEVTTQDFSIFGWRPTAPAETIPWGIDRIYAPLVWTSTTANSVKVAVIDTGIDLKHPDLKDNIKGGYNAITPRFSANDNNGHGTHVAGIIAALDNTIGVVGVAPQMDLYSVKVLDKFGSGYLSDVIEGIDWSIANKVNIINMSLGSPDNVLSFHDAVARAYNAGIVVVAAAGNSGQSVLYPAAYPEVIAVSATNNNDGIADFSSRGPEVDLSAPGVDIYSTYKGSAYKTLSGTSMASPHVAGVAALLLSMPEKCDFDGNGVCSPDEVLKKLTSTSIDFGDLGYDNLYGAGLVNAFAALQ